MEYIKKEELIKGEIYHVQDGDFWMIGLVTKSNNGDNNWSLRGDATYITSKNKFEINTSWAYKSDTRTYRLATPNEKHWLNCCITANKFITFEEAMKTFIPEYVECLMVNTASMHSKYQGIIPILNKIYEVAERSFPEKGVRELAVITKCGVTMYDKHTKPSTKEAYNAQFVVKEPAENKTELEIWLENTKSLNLSLDVLTDYIGNPLTCDFDNIFKKLEGFMSKDKANILFNKWNDQVIEPLPQFKIIETIETITKVENNEGNQFFIGDKIKVSLNMVQKIISFSYNEDKTEIFANFNQNLSISINDIEHYIEPKVEVEETLLEKAKRLYPIGTKVKSVSFNDVRTIGTDIFKEINHEYSGKIIYADNGRLSIYSEQKDKWAEIIK